MKDVVGLAGTLLKMLRPADWLRRREGDLVILNKTSGDVDEDEDISD